MSGAERAIPDDEEDAEVEQAVTLKEFLEKTHPSVQRQVDDFWEIEIHGSSKRRKILYPELRLHCSRCEGDRTFRVSSRNDSHIWEFQLLNTHPIFRCGDCHQKIKQYALRIEFGDAEGVGAIYKYGETPPYGIPVPNRVLRLVGSKDAALFQKGRQCESLGYGIAAFAYYRRVVENHRNDLFEEIIKVCRTLDTSPELVEQLKAAQNEISFSKSMEKVKAALPQGLLINGHNPLIALHGALSVGLHGQSDEDCLDTAQAVRIVLSELVERIALLKQENTQLNAAVQRLISSKG